MSRIRKTKISDSVLEEIRRQILDGELREGDKLPCQDLLAAKMGVSRSSLREALQSLSLVGAIEQRPGVGTVVKHRANALLAGKIDRLSASGFSFLDLLETRHLLEVNLIDLVVVRITDQELQLLEQSIQNAYFIIKEGRNGDYYQEDLSFHILLAQASHNLFLAHLISVINYQVEGLMREYFRHAPHNNLASLQHHQSIVRALKKRNKAAARRAMYSHFTWLKKQALSNPLVIHKAGLAMESKD